MVPCHLLQEYAVPAKTSRSESTFSAMSWLTLEPAQDLVLSLFTAISCQELEKATLS